MREATELLALVPFPAFIVPRGRKAPGGGRGEATPNRPFKDLAAKTPPGSEGALVELILKTARAGAEMEFLPGERYAPRKFSLAGGLDLVCVLPAEPDMAMGFRIFEDYGHYRSITEMLIESAACFDLGPDGSFRHVWSLGSFLKKQGYDWDDIDGIGKWRGIVHPEDLGRFDAAVKRILAGEKAELEMRITSGSGKWTWVRGCYKPQAVAGGLRIVTTLADIGAEKENGLGLEERAETLAAMARLSGEAFHILRSPGKPGEAIVLANGRLGSALGYAEGELLGRPFRSLDPGQAAGRALLQAALLPHGGELSFDADFLAKDGSSLPVRVRAQKVVAGGFESLVCLDSFSPRIKESNTI